MAGRLNRSISTVRIPRFMVLQLGALTIACQATGDGAVDPFDPDILPRLELTEVSRIGGHDDRETYSLSGVSSAIMLSTDEIALADGGSQEIRVYGMRGDYCRARKHKSSQKVDCCVAFGLGWTCGLWRTRCVPLDANHGLCLGSQLGGSNSTSTLSGGLIPRISSSAAITSTGSS